MDQDITVSCTAGVVTPQQATLFSQFPNPVTVPALTAWLERGGDVVVNLPLSQGRNRGAYTLLESVVRFGKVNRAVDNCGESEPPTEKVAACISLLLESGARVTPRAFLFTMERHPQLIELMLKTGADPSAHAHGVVGVSSITPLRYAHHCLKCGKEREPLVEVVDLLLRHGADLSSSQLPLSDCEDKEVRRKLILAGAHLPAATSVEETSFWLDQQPPLKVFCCSPLELTASPCVTGG